MIDIDFTPIMDWIGEAETVALAGLLVGALFGVCAQRSRFCLRASVVEFARGEIGPKTAVWLLAFSTAVFWVQALSWSGGLELTEARWRTATASISGAVIGGLLVGAGMILARGCPGRLVVLAASGNLRSLLAGLVFAVAAQTSLYGALAPLRESLAGLWTTGGPNPDLIASIGLRPEFGLALGVAAAAAALSLAWRAQVSARTLWFGSGVGFTVAAGWWLTYQLAAQTFDPTPIESITFSGPSADLLMAVLAPDGVWDFDLGVTPGVVLGAALAAAAFGEWRWEGFKDVANMQRSIIGAALMGFGAMLAGGCAVGAGVTGGATFALTAWIALTAFWLGGGATDLALRRLERRETHEDRAPQPA
ncbi:MAG: YeeE/YedE family protein [Pseudomonadota bacterium]